MSKLSPADKMTIQALREQGHGTKAAHPFSNSTPSERMIICQRVDQTGFATVNW